MKPWLVSHRGASRHAQENTLDAFAAARTYPIGYIELDVRVTADDIAIVHHDPAVAGLAINNHTYEQLLEKDQSLARFSDVIAASGDTRLIIELKVVKSAKHVTDYLLSHPRSYATSFYLNAIEALADLGVSRQQMFLAKPRHPIGLLNTAINNKLRGVSVNQWYLNPLLYKKARKNNLLVLTYTVNSQFKARCIRKWLPGVLICTDRPDKLKGLQ